MEYSESRVPYDMDNDRSFDIKDVLKLYKKKGGKNKKDKPDRSAAFRNKMKDRGVKDF